MLKYFISHAVFVINACLISFYSFAADRLEQPAIIRANPEQALLLSIAQADTRLVSVGEQGVIVISDNQGLDWQQVPVPVSTLLTSVKFSNASTAWVVGHDGAVLTSNTKGESWHLVLTGRDINDLRQKALENEVNRLSTTDADPTDIENLTYALDEAIYANEDGPTSPLLDVLFINDKTGFIIGAYGLLLTTENGGNSWQYIGHKLPNPDGLHLNRIYQLTSKRLLLLGEAGLLLKSDDLGDSWQEFNSPYDGSFFSAAESDSLYIMGLVGHSYRFDEPSETWEPVSLPTTATINDAIVIDDQLIITGQGGALLRQDANGFSAIGERQLRSFTSVIHTDNTLVLTGETGITRVSLGKE